jgi:hypothetical protein
LIQLQLHTAARGGELLKLRAIDIDTTGNVWLYHPTDHKTAHHGHKRTIYLGPQAQSIVHEFMINRPVDAYLFSPREAEAERHVHAKTHRRPNHKPNLKKTSRVIGDYYTRDSYRRCIARACKQANTPKVCQNITDLKKEIQSRKRSVYTTITQVDIFEMNTKTSTDFLNENIPEPQYYWAPFCSEGSLNLLFAAAGTGKTWLSLILGGGVTRKDYQNIKLHNWQVNKPAGVLYIDGEMHPSFLQKRMRQLFTPLGEENPAAPFRLISASQVSQRHHERINLADNQWRKTVSQYLKAHNEYSILIIDNIASLFSGINENNKQDWDPINQWLLSLRDMGKAVLLVHHAGKSKKSGQRGCSSRIDNLDNVILLSKVQSPTDRKGTAFEVNFDKCRNVKPGMDRPFIVSIYDHPEFPGCLTWNATQGESPTEKQKKAEQLLIQGGMKNKDVAETVCLSEGRISQIKTELGEKGLIKVRKKSQVVPTTNERSDENMQSSPPIPEEVVPLVVEIHAAGQRLIVYALAFFLSIS